MDTIEILGKEYEVIDSLERINVADSFVLINNKINEGSGEAKLYVGQVTGKLETFFGQRGFVLNCFFSKQNLINYLNSAYSEYNEPTQNYRSKEQLPTLWESRKKLILSKDSLIYFKIADQNQIVGSRQYIKYSDEKSKETYELLRELSLPIISYINIYKLYNTDNKNYIFYFKLFLNGSSDALESRIDSNIIDSESSKFIPLSDENTEIEKEDVSDPSTKENTSQEIQIPFDPNNIRIRTDPSTIGQIKNDLEHGIINLNTEFQRLPNLWDDSKMSRFIESLLLRLPIPAFYFNEADNNTIEVVDGLQRVSTVKRFLVDGDLKLSNLEFLKNGFGNLGFNDLDYIYQRRILTFPITTYIIEKGTPHEVKFNIFKRVNTGGLELTAQEIRHAINQGKPAKLLEDMVNIETPEGLSFHIATDWKMSNSKRMEDRDFANRFLAFYILDYKTYKPDLDTFLNAGLAKVKTDADSVNVKSAFLKSMNLAFEIFGRDAFRKRLSIYDNRKPINKSIFDALSVSLAKLSDTQANTLKLKQEQFKEKFINLNNDFGFLRAITQGTAQRDSVIKRFEEIEKIINETLADND